MTLAKSTCYQLWQIEPNFKVIYDKGENQLLQVDLH